MRTFEFDLSNPICKILSRYFSLEHFLLPYYEVDQIIYFHHQTLLGDGLCNVHLDGLYFNENDILLEIIDVFHRNNEPELAFDILNIHYHSDEPTGDEAKDKYFNEIRSTMTFFELLTENHTLERLLKEASVSQTEPFWAGRLAAILHIFNNTPLFYQRAILALLISSGCNAQCIFQAYHYSANTESFLPILREKFRQKCIDTHKQKGELPDHLIYILELDNAGFIDLYAEKPPFWYYTLDIFDVF